MTIKIDNEQRARDNFARLFIDNREAVRAQETIQRQLVRAIEATAPQRKVWRVSK